MSLTLAAVAAVVAALFELTVFPYLSIGGATPHPVLVLGIVWAVAVGVEGALVWAFVGGLALDVLAQRPLGMSAFALLVAVGGSAVLANLLGRFRILAPVLATAILSPVYSLTLITILGALRPPVPLADPVAAVMPGVIYDVVLAAVIGPLAVAVSMRRREAERVDW